MSGRNELVFVVPRDAVPDAATWHGVRRVDPAPLFAAAEAAGEFVPRAEAEVDPSRKQLIPYLVVREGDRIFLMRRTRAGGDARLHDRYSIGVGGHLNPGDGDVPGCLIREWQEEIEADFVPSFEYVGLLNDDTTEVGSVHLGVVYLADAGGRAVTIRERDKLSGSFETLEACRAVYDLMETWSQLVLDALDPIAPPDGAR